MDESMSQHPCSQLTARMLCGSWERRHTGNQLKHDLVIFNVKLRSAG